jgi:hypothetical protein
MLTMEALQVLAGALALGSLLWAIRRFLPKVRCPHCQSTNWIFMGDMKQCSTCGKLFV